MKHDFKCPYAEAELRRPCEVGSCNFNLADSHISRTYKRCFLNYQESLRYNPFALEKDKSFDYNALPLKQKHQLVASFFNTNSLEVDRVHGEFYASIFAVMVEDTVVGLKRQRLSPVPFKQCAVCGNECDHLYYPKSNALPEGYGYCAYTCFQLKPPPVLVVEKNLEVDFFDLLKALAAETTQDRPRFVRQIVDWILSRTPLV